MTLTPRLIPPDGEEPDRAAEYEQARRRMVQMRQAEGQADQEAVPMSEKLTLEGVRQRTEQVLAMDRHDADPESAHSAQDRLYVDVLRAVVAGHPDAAAMAEDCLRVEDSDGTRWWA